MNSLEAYKMDGLGNDFIIFDKREKSFFQAEITLDAIKLFLLIKTLIVMLF
jgi:diaminopimelate epimerase